jgi:esterase
MKLFFRKYGSGPPLIILHGLYGSSDNWATIAKNISDSFTVYLPDQRNHGQSPHSPIHDYDSMSNDVHELATDQKLNKFFLAGHSMGGKTAISFSLKWPEMLNGLLIADISPFKNENSNTVAFNQNLTILRSILSIDLSRISARDDVRKALFEKISSEKTIGLILKNLERTHSNSFKWKVNASSLIDNLDRIMEGIDPRAYINHQITGFPVMFLRGDESDYLPESDIKNISLIFPAAEFITIKGAGHWLHADKPEEVIKNLRRLKE